MNPIAPDSGIADDRPHVPIAEYLYRHEAEFAAGFLRDAGIPFRLQIDDAGGADAGVTIARPAVLWVRAEHEEEARAILDLDDSSASVARSPATHDADEAGPPGDASPTPSHIAFEPLCRAERLLAGILALALFGLAASGGEGAVPWVGVWESIALGLALALGLSAVSGQTVGPIKAILRTLSGTLP
ncbi:MAG: hypothetical protein WD995_06290 [Gemmatimonadota bacterium]